MTTVVWTVGATCVPGAADAGDDVAAVGLLGVVVVAVFGCELDPSSITANAIAATTTTPMAAAISPHGGRRGAGGGGGGVTPRCVYRAAWVGSE